MAIAARTTAVVTFAICFIFDVGCSCCGAVVKGASRGGCADDAGASGAVLELFNALFGTLAGARFFFGFRPRLLGIRVTSGVVRSGIRRRRKYSVQRIFRVDALRTNPSLASQ